MRDYAKIAPHFWIGPTGKKIRKLGAEAQVIALYLLSSPHANMIGLYHMPIAYISADTGIPFEGASKGLLSIADVGFCAYDETAEVVWVYEMARFQIAELLKPGDNRCQGVQNSYDEVPNNQFLSAFFEKYATSFNLTKQRGLVPPPIAPSKPLPSQEQEQEQEQEQKQEQEQDGSGAEKSAPPEKAAGSDSEKPETDLQAACRKTWAAYGTAYFNRYGTEPVRNVTVNTQVKNFVKRLGAEESPHVAAFFVQSNSAFYIQRLHSFGNLLADAEKVRTEWATGRDTSGAAARAEALQSDNAQAKEAARKRIFGEEKNATV